MLSVQPLCYPFSVRLGATPGYSMTFLVIGSVIFHGFPWFSTVFHGFPWFSTIFHGIPWFFHEFFHDFPWFKPCHVFFPHFGDVAHWPGSPPREIPGVIFVRDTSSRPSISSRRMLGPAGELGPSLAQGWLGKTGKVTALGLAYLFIYL